MIFVHKFLQKIDLRQFASIPKKRWLSSETYAKYRKKIPSSMCYTIFRTYGIPSNPSPEAYLEIELCTKKKATMDDIRHNKVDFIIVVTEHDHKHNRDRFVDITAP